MKPSKLTIKSVDGSPDTIYVQLDKVKELIEGNQPPTGDSILAKSIDGFSFLLALEILQEQLEDLE